MQNVCFCVQGEGGYNERSVRTFSLAKYSTLLAKLGANR